MDRISFSDSFKKDLTYDRASRKQKAEKLIAILTDCLGDLSKLNCLDLGCSIGLITEFLADHFKSVTGADVDQNAIKVAKKRVKKSGLKFAVSSEKKLPFKSEQFDVVVCNQVYEHVEDPESLIREIKRVLKRDGVCLLGARNKIGLLDGHYRLPFLSLMPKKWADFYIKLFTGKPYYDINLLPVWGLERLVKGLNKQDYTLRVIENPKKFKARDVVPEVWGVNKLIGVVGKSLYFLIPNYLWLLEKDQ